MSHHQPTDCPTCGSPCTLLAVRGESASQYLCRGCGEAFELDRPRIEPMVEFKTRARLLFPINEQVG